MLAKRGPKLAHLITRPSLRYRPLPDTENDFMWGIRSGKLCDTVAKIRAVNWSQTIALLNQDPQSVTDEFYSIIRTAEDLHQPIKDAQNEAISPGRDQASYSEEAAAISAGLQAALEAASRTHQAEDRRAQEALQPHFSSIFIFLTYVDIKYINRFVSTC